MPPPELAAVLARLCPRCPEAVLPAHAAAAGAACAEFGIVGPTRQAAFLAQAAHETQGLTRLEENLNYGAERLCATWPKRFTAESAARYARRPEAIANRAYADRMGNGPEASGDGWRYRGRGALHLTGRELYRRIGQLLGLELEALPDQVATPAVAWHAGAAYWHALGLNELADLARADGPAEGAAAVLTRITRRINGGLTGQPERLALFERAQQCLAA